MGDSSKRILAIGVAVLHIIFLLSVLVYMAGGLHRFFHPASLAIGFWAISPVVFLAWRINESFLWLIALVPFIIFGSYAVYDMAFGADSSTAALGWIFIPFYQWVFIGIVAVAKRFPASA